MAPDEKSSQQVLNKQAVSNGLKLELRPVNKEIDEGDMPVFNAVITNVSSRDVLFCTYQLKHRLLTTLMGEGYEVYPFAPTPKPPLTNRDFRTLSPGEALTVRLDVKNEPDYHFLYAGHLPPVVDASSALKGFPKGDYVFQAHTGTHISFFNAPKGKYNHGRERRNILKDVEQSNLSIDPNRAWKGDMIAQRRVKVV